ncbi:MAG TPA: c-type cytochrome domain-containing protein [Anaerolineales bacterium]|jgi:mono/diheme cytochrome c family protein
MLTRIKAGLKRFFFPPAGSARWLFVLPYIVLLGLGLMLLVGGVYGWDYTNSPQFCGTACHTMPPQNVTYKQSPHANVACEECHIGRAFIGDQLARKSEGLRELYAQTFKTYELPIIASRLRPARETCETCHLPEAFKDDKLKVITHFQDDKTNTPLNIYLVLKTGGGAKRDGQGKGIHWHIVNKVEYYETDPLGQTIPYVRVHNDDGSITEYTDVQSGFDPKSIDQSKLRVMDCTSCHNRVSHNFKAPATSMDEYLAKSLIDPAIPEIHAQGVKVLSPAYQTQAEGLKAISGLEDFYKTTYADFYTKYPDSIKNAVTQIQKIYSETVFIDQKVNWESHPNNIGHIQTAGCFRCHDGKHLDANQQAIRLECNLCHSIPVVASQQDFVTRIEISRGPEPDSHRNPNWISMHNKVFDQTCAACHNTADAGSTTNTSFCSNSACHGSKFTYAGFDAPKLRDIIQSQLPTPTAAPPAAPTPAAGIAPDYAANIQPLFTKCAACHNATALTGGLDLSSYAALMKGGKDGPVITPKDSANSTLVKIQSATHFANLSPAELDLVKAWIDAGAPAPKASEATPTGAAPGGSPTFDANIAATLTAKCAVCHKGATAPKGLDLTSYANLMKGGADGVVVVARDAAGSKLIQVQSSPHAVNLTPDELALFKQWIDAGAVEK